MYKEHCQVQCPLTPILVISSIRKNIQPKFLLHSSKSHFTHYCHAMLSISAAYCAMQGLTVSISVKFMYCIKITKHIIE